MLVVVRVLTLTVLRDSLNRKFSVAFSIIGMFSSHAVSTLSIFFCAEITPTVIRWVRMLVYKSVFYDARGGGLFITRHMFGGWRSTAGEEIAPCSLPIVTTYLQRAIFLECKFIWSLKPQTPRLLSCFTLYITNNYCGLRSADYGTLYPFCFFNYFLFSCLVHCVQFVLFKFLSSKMLTRSGLHFIGFCTIQWQWGRFVLFYKIKLTIVSLQWNMDVFPKRK